MPISFVCSCGKQLQVADEFAGRRAKCQACGALQTVPKPVVEVSALEVVEEPEDEECTTFDVVDPRTQDETMPSGKKKKKPRRRSEDEEGPLTEMYMAEARELAEREEARMREEGNDDGGWTFLGVHVTAGVLGGGFMLLTGTIALIALGFYRDNMGGRAQGRAFIAAIAYTAIGLVALFRALMGEEE